MISLSTNGMEAESYHGAELAIGGIEIEWRDNEEGNLVEFMSLIGNSPNPWSYSTDLRFYLPSSGKVNLIIKDANGRLLLNKVTELNSGKNSISITDNEVNIPGVHIYELRFKDQIVNGKMIKI